MADRSDTPLVAVTVLSTLWLDGLAVGFLLDLATPIQLLAACWALSFPLVPLVVADGEGTGALSWPLIVALELPVVNVLAGLGYAIGRHRAARPSKDGLLGHGGLYGLGIASAALSLVVAPFLTGLIALGCGYRVRSAYHRRQGSLLLAVAGVLMLAGLVVNVVIFLFLRPGPIL
ncbi:hypothetical protein [Haloarcula montana]|uniref:hypothetical protein n=1 Tax=Haloarcula montana TaxID=3111776 RepID=UPI002D76F4AF|nr:hypothetical protein [Haloarcula sp. GH36]